MKVHPTAIIHPKAEIAESAVVGPYAVIGEGVELDEDSEVMAHAVLAGPTKIGKGNRFFPFASIGQPPQDMKYQGEPTRLEIGDGNTFRESVTVHRGTAQAVGVTRIGNFNLLMAYVHIAHDCQLGNHIVMANGASLAGHVEIGDHAIIGAFCGIHQFTRIGAHSFLGAYTVVNKDILPFMKTTTERPMTVLGPNRIGLERDGISQDAIEELEVAFRLLCRSKLNTTQALEAIEQRGFSSEHVKTLVEFIRRSERGVAK
ncbi:MAG: acyl-ACP--UDP-N-acetylglucosamine O-acyltransferase [Acidobacteria bacterium]|jgi:UDP-N-acetylglucosamine acyltransferase|nr:acyl-ACP--UDP-N-acetylglucosamine O-acyltransferase [Acidobacteriota bacterium]